MLSPVDYLFGLSIVFMTFVSVRRKKFTALYTLFISIIFNFIFKYISSKPTTLFIPTTGPSLALQISITMGFFFKIMWLFAAAIMILRPVSWIATLSALFLGAGLGIWVIKGSRKIKQGAQEVRRKTFHTTSGLLMGIIAISVGQKVAIIVTLIGIITALSFPLIMKISFINELGYSLTRGKENPGEILFKFFIGILLPLMLNQPWIVLIIAIGDGVATLIGKFFGKTKIYGSKSLEGSFAGFLGAWAVSNQFYAHPIFAATLYAVTELFTPIDDNLSVPTIMSMLYVPWGAIWNGIITFIIML